MYWIMYMSFVFDFINETKKCLCYAFRSLHSGVQYSVYYHHIPREKYVINCTLFYEITHAKGSNLKWQSGTCVLCTVLDYRDKAYGEDKTDSWCCSQEYEYCAFVL